MSKIAITVNGHKAFSSNQFATTCFDSSSLRVYNDAEENPEIVFFYVFRPGECATVQILDHVETISIITTPLAKA